MKLNFCDHVFSYILVPSIFIVGIISFYRFIIKNDYVVSYEGVCDPTINSCFIGCTDDECKEEYYYSKIIKYAPDLYKQCGRDITECKKANECLPEDTKCSITYCDNSKEECKFLDESSVDSLEDNLKNI